MHRGHRSRADLRLAAPDSRSFNVHPERGGCAVHYLGAATGISLDLAEHDRCEEVWRQVQRFHMGPTRNYVDVAYTAAFCQHGYTLAGRGLGVRTGANGTNDANDRYLAFCFIGGGSEIPSADALDGLDYLIGEARADGAGDDVRPHSSFKPTGCPGPHLRTYAVGQRDGAPVVPVVPPVAPQPPKVAPAPPTPTPTPVRPAPTPTTGLDLSAVENIKYGDRNVQVGRLQGLLLAEGYRTFSGSLPDKDWGPRVDAALRSWCIKKGLLRKGYTGPIVAGKTVFTRLVTG